MKHVNIPIFIPHLGCPNDCAFCNQRKITGHMQFSAESVIPQIEGVLKTLNGQKAQISFFGGSFTGIDRPLMIKLLEIGQDYIKSDMVDSLRCSTRPDYINEEILDILLQYGVKTIELGVQSTSDKVLSACSRGHNAECAVKAMGAVKAHGFELIGQMMTCLPESTLEDEINTASDICKSGADGARIYPLVVFKDTALEKMVQTGKYIPVDEEENVFRAKEVKKVFLKHGVPVIRLGLQAQDNLTASGDISAGGYQPAIGAMADSAIYLDIITEQLEKYDKAVLKNAFATVNVARGETSSAVGMRKINKTILTEKYGLYKIKVVERDALAPFEASVRIVPDKRRCCGCI